MNQGDGGALSSGNVMRIWGSDDKLSLVVISITARQKKQIVTSAHEVTLRTVTVFGGVKMQGGTHA